MNKKSLGKLGVFVLALLSAIGISFRPNPKPAEPAPTATVAPSASPVPTMTRLPEPEPVPAAACILPPSDSNECINDPQTEPNFWRVVQAAQRHAEQNGFIGEDGRVKGDRAYVDEVARLVRVDGFCAINGHEGGHSSYDELWQKDSNGFSEHFDIVTADNKPWFHFAARCIPAKF